jgi:hypothetical protein
LLLTQTGGSWSAAKADVSALNNTTNPNVVANSVSCASAGNCSAVGSYTDSSGNRQGLLLGTTASPAMALSAPASGTAGSAIAPASLSASLSRGFSPTGTITFRVFGPQATPPSSCASGATVASATAAGNASYSPTAGFTPPSAGNYWWYASYTGDPRNDPAASACGAGMPVTTVARAVVPANSAFSTLSVKIDHKTGAITFTESVSNPGTFHFMLTFPNGKFGVIAAKNKTKCKPGRVRLKGKCRAAKLSFGSGSKTVAVAGTVSFTVKPSPAAARALKQALRHRKGLSVTATLTYQSARGGSAVTHTQTILDKLSKTKMKHKK